ncbi:MAG TPA: hypothetical protein VFO29_01400 [Candidatus Rubrimentiphilum sp.]|nr:hypothetical protein [Candidatus Rubrimentiphilum sp.]
MKQLLASLTAAAFLMTGTAMAANAPMAKVSPAAHMAKPSPKPTKKPWRRKGIKPGKPTPKPSPKSTKKPWRRNGMKPGKPSPKPTKKP